MRLRNILMLCAFTAMSIGVVSCGKKAEEEVKTDSTAMAPAAPASAAPTVNADTAKAAAEKMKEGAEKMKEGAKEVHDAAKEAVKK